MTNERWWTLRKTSTGVNVEYGHTHATLFATDVKMQKGPPVTISLSLDGNLAEGDSGLGTYADAKDLADGDIRRLTRLELSDEHVLSGLKLHLEHTEEPAPPWRLIVHLRGQHTFSVMPEYHTGTLALRVGGPS